MNVVLSGGQFWNLLLQMLVFETNAEFLGTVVWEGDTIDCNTSRLRVPSLVLLCLPSLCLLFVPTAIQRHRPVLLTNVGQ